MAIQILKPTTPGQRGMARVTREGLSRAKPTKSLIGNKKKNGKTGGRNSAGRISVRHKGGGHKRRYREIDFKRNEFDGIEATVKAIEYDPNRSARIALIVYKNGAKRYTLATEGVKVGSVVMTGKDAPIKEGNTLALADIPVGRVLHSIELKPGQGAKRARSAGTSARLVAKEGEFAMIRCPSSEVYRVRLECRATLGVVSNGEHNKRKLGKAGASRWRGIRPTVRGVAMNPVDHPHGGGEGRTSGGRHPVTPWGKPTKGGKTRNNKQTEQYIVTKRRKKRRK